VRKIRVGVIGSGVAGLSAAWLLSQRHDVTLIESAPRLGGHANTAHLHSAGRDIAIDTGFIVYNPATYPNLSALLSYLDVAHVEAPMGFSVSAEAGRFEYSGESLGHLLGTGRQWFSPRQWRMVADLVRFYRGAEMAGKAAPATLTLGQFLKQGGYGDTFIRRHILPMAGAIWSATPDEIAQYPFKAFTAFFANHRLFALGERPLWRTVKGGAESYVKSLCDDARFQVLLNTPVASVRRGPKSVALRCATGKNLEFDHVVLATHGDQALRLLGDPSPAEKRLLGPFQTSANRVYLHRDPALMPVRRRFWSSWNYRSHEVAGEKLAVTYWMNALQNLDTPEQHFVSLNPAERPAVALTDAAYDYRHPIFNAATLQAQQELWSLHGVNRTWFCGAWFGSGFHEDGAQAGLAVAEQLGGLPRPWKVEAPSGRIHVGPAPEIDPAPFVAAAE
jgi:predicted NAD/FAD-binding protein